MRSATILAVLVIVAACGPNVPEFMEATIDGALWQAERVTCLYRNQELRVTGSRSTGADTRRAIRLAELRLTGPRTVTLAAGGEQGFVLDQDAIGWDTHVGYSTTETLTGTVTVTDFDLGGQQCAGTFSFVAVMVHNLYGPVTPDTLRITDGSWSAELMEY